MGNVKWIANKNGWAKPEGTQQPPDFDPLKLRVTEKWKSKKDFTPTLQIVWYYLMDNVMVSVWGKKDKILNSVIVVILLEKKIL